MTAVAVDAQVIESAVELGCRAPSLHNSQPWRWVAEEKSLQLFADSSRIGHHTDSTGREVILSCGAVLDHVRIAMAAAGWAASITRYPSADDPEHLAGLEFDRAQATADDQALADAIGRRRTDRLPFATPDHWDPLAAKLRTLAEDRDVYLDVIDEDRRAALVGASRMTEHVRMHEESYHAELRWWTGQTDPSQGIPPDAVASPVEAQHVDVARRFPTGSGGDRRPELDRDESMILVLSTYDDSPEVALICGEVLSTVLLECTRAGLATCTLTHLMEVSAARDVVRRQIGRSAQPQVLIRVGQAPESPSQAQLTPRRPLAEVLTFRS
ncbi:NAD(P)H nitroreductase [Mycobacterium sp. CVI_P3]|uniref:NAD(P)H nitroreductase n=1 Tax=Mycobacterium pinniadriaticum TaxID=2994102 RepID=A0ABT3SLN0_9MYCO|nr:NAD(P)H nitroreductase [Mycobacterium pinniadriaticum]MCX2933976.1 NAD(P)H nitroreductase [Mycobacterium pinniadriaticum]MCX2940428.1 NAD(P)H nitroreductase [Mycobacterium pinniadriaticum]